MPAKSGEVRELRARLEAAEAALGFRDETIRDLRRRLDAERARSGAGFDRGACGSADRASPSAGTRTAAGLVALAAVALFR